MGLLISTQSYRNDKPTPYGILVDMDAKTGEIIRQLRIETPVETNNKEGRLKPGLRGMFEYQEKVYVASWNTVFVVDKVSFKVEKEISHKWMSDLHGIYVDDDGIWVTSSLPDALILYDFEGNPRSTLWMSETFIYSPHEPVDKEIDWRYIGKDFRGFREYHANHVELKGKYVYLTGRGDHSKGRVMRFLVSDFIEKEKLDDNDMELIIEGLYGPHDGMWNGDYYWVTETMNSSIAAIDAHGKVVLRKKVLAKDEGKVKYDGLKDVLKTIKKKLKKKGGKMVTHWTRGLSIDDKNIYVGQSTWAGEATSRARVVKFNRANTKVIDTFYIDIQDYPETRIFQLLQLKP